jgi:3-hydroxy acid dehydrogenase/malonic semialdehyde reductase
MMHVTDSSHDSEARRTAVVTGASSGIGKAISQLLLREGWSVVGIARDFTKFACDDAGFTPVALDFAELAELPSQLEKLAGEFHRVDALICCAGKGRFGHLEQFSYTQMRELFDLNFTSQAFVVRAFLPRMKRSGRGDIIIMGSEAALRGTRQGSLYCASKFALRGFAQALREETAASGVRVCLVNPGMVRTPFFAELDFKPGDEPDHHILPEDVAAVVLNALQLRDGTNVDEINLSPQKRVIDFHRGARANDETGK